MAAATLTYDYSASTAWLAAPETEPHPMNHDLCERHADGLRVPQGWQLQDERRRLTSIDARLAS
jgi:hypothetical protein